MMSNYDKQVDIGRACFLRYDQETLAKKYNLPMDTQYLYVTYLSGNFRINRETAAVEEEGRDGFMECREYSVVMTIYDMLCCNTDSVLPPLSGEWTPVGSFAAVGASPDANRFVQPYADAFSGHVDELIKACQVLGEIQPRIAGADVTARIAAFPFFPVLFQFWEGDEEFSPRIRLLWDKRTMRYLRFETTYYLQGDLMKRLKNMLDNQRIPS